MRVTGYKLFAKSIINESMGKCLLSSGVLLLPKFIFATTCFALYLLYMVGIITNVFLLVGTLISLIIMFILNAFFTPVGELMLYYLASEDADEYFVPAYEEDDMIETTMEVTMEAALEFAVDSAETEVTREFRISPEYTDSYESTYIDNDIENDFDIHSQDLAYEPEPEVRFFDIVNLVRDFGIGRLIKLRLVLLATLARDVALSALPALVLVTGLIAYLLYASVPTGAFIAISVGIVAIFILALVELSLEYDKYRFTYMGIDEFTEDFSLYTSPYKSMLMRSVEISSDKMAYIRRCEISFWGWAVLSVVLLPFLFPILYFLAYKKLTFYNAILQ